MFVESLPDDVTWFSSSQNGSQQMMGHSNGDMLKVLDDCLINGFNELPASSITLYDNNLTIGFDGAHGFLKLQTVFISGADDPLLNGNHKIRSSTNTSIDLYVAGATVTTGTITVKVAPLGWQSIFGATDPLRRAYRSNSSNSLKRVLYIDMDKAGDGTYGAGTGYAAENPALEARVSVCQDMQIMSEQIGPMTQTAHGTAGTNEGSLFWYQKREQQKVTAVKNTRTQWRIVGNAEFFYLIINWSAIPAIDSLVGGDVYGFGQFAGLNNEPQDRTFLMATYNINSAAVALTGSMGGRISSSNAASIGAFVPQSGQLAFINASVAGIANNTVFFSGLNYIAYPNPVGSTLITLPMRIAKSADTKLTGLFPSMLYIENNIALVDYDETIQDGVLILAVQKQNATGFIPAFYGFYIGG